MPKLHSRRMQSTVNILQSNKSSLAFRQVEDRIRSVFFANQFVLRDPAGAFRGINFVLSNGQEHNTVALGNHNFSTELSGTKNFLRLLEWYSGKDNLVLSDVHVIQTGIKNHQIITHHFDTVEEPMMRILINLREEEGQHVALGININQKKDQKVLLWLDMDQSFGTILPASLSELTFITSNQNIPTKRRQNGRSLYIIMDIIPQRDTQYNVADEIQKSMRIKSEDLVAQLKQLHANGTIPADKLQEMMKDPENAFKNMMASQADTTETRPGFKSEDEKNMTQEATHGKGEDEKRDT
jgi:hypothetical protein